MHDRALTGFVRQRVAQAHAPDLMVRSWLGLPPANRAAMIAAEGDLDLAARCDPERWGPLIGGDVRSSLRIAASDPSSLPLRLVEAESLLAGGAILAGLEVLGDAHRRGFAPAGVALARRFHQLGHHRRAIEVASELPLHAHPALVRARSAMAIERPREALRALAPLLEGAAPLPDTQIAGACAVVAAAALARAGFVDRLRAFARSLLGASDLDDAFLPYAARIAWTAGEAAAFWDLLGETPSPGAQAARLELAVLAGDGDRAAACLAEAGTAGAPSIPAVSMLLGTLDLDPAAAPMLDDPETRVHVWRTPDDACFDPWVRAIERSAANVSVYRLAHGPVPEPDDVASMVLESSSLLSVVAPERMTPEPRNAGSSVHVDDSLCRGIALGLDWPAEERRILTAGVGDTATFEKAACVVGPPAAALRAHRRGAACVVVAPPGDPFWNGVLPERTFSRLKIVRSDPRSGWTGGGRAALDALEALRSADGEGGDGGL